MQSAFVNVGLERDAFLYVSDFLLDEDEDAETLEHVAPRPYIMTSAPEPRTEGDTEPLEAEAGVPPFAVEAEEAEAGPNGAQQRETDREGPRRWKGRRRRGRGRDRFQERDQDRSHGHPEQTHREHDHVEHDRAELHAESNQQESGSVGPQPSETVPESRPPETFREARPQAFSPHHQAIVLPGESISKYQPQSAAPASSTPAPARPAPSQSTARPSTEFSLDPSQFSANSMVLPGESLAKYRSTATRKTVPVAEPSTPAPIEHSEHVQPEVHVHEVHEPEAVAPSHEIDVPPTMVEIPAAIQEDAGPRSGSVSVVEEREEPIEHKATEAVDVPSAFEGAAVEPEDTQEHAAASDNSQSQATPPVGIAGPGVMVEEEIEEEESEFPSFEEQFDLDDLGELEVGELEEQEMDLVPLGSEFTEAVRDAHTAEIVTGQYQSEGLEAGEEFDEAAETVGDAASAEDEEDIEHSEVSDEVEEGSAEMRAPVPTAGYQQRTERRGDRRGPGRKPGRRMKGRPRPHAQRTFPAITDLLKEGQEILVQIAKEPIAKKGARITSHIALPGRFLVYMPTVHHTGVSRKIASEEERQRLKRIVLSERGDAHGGFIVRTAAAAATEDDLRADIRFLINLWTEIRNRADAAKAPALIYHDLNLVERILRDQVTTSFSAIWVDSEQEYERVLRFVSRFQPSLVKRVKLYTKDAPLFEQFSISEEINKALKSKVWLKSGGYIVINQTEALVAIDINTGKYVGKTARLEDTIVKTNIDAIKEIVRQIRLRDLGGIIVIDFIDMDERKNRQRVMQALEEALKADRAPSKVLQFNDFGLVAITRKRVKQSLERTLGQQCTTCTGTGMIKSVTTVCNEIYVEVRKMARRFEHDIVLRVHPDIAKALKSTNNRWLEEMEELTKRTVLVKSDPLLHPEQFDLQ
jgi:ribonuclease G